MNWRKLGQSIQKKLNQRRWRVLATSLLLGPAIAFIAWRTYQNWGVLRQHNWQLHPARWGGALLGYSLSLFCLLWAWHRLLAQLGHSLRFGTNTRIYCLSNLTRRIPGGLWYMAGRVHLYREQDVPASVVLTGTALEIVLFAFTGMLTFLLSLPLSQSGWSSYLGIALAVLLAALLVLQPPVLNRLLRFLLRRLGSEEQVEITYRGLGPLILGYLGGWVFTGAGLYMAIISLYPLPWTELPDIVGLWALSGTVGMLASTFLLLGAGVREIALTALLVKVVHILDPIAAAIAVLFWFVITVGEVLWAGVFVPLDRLQRKQSQSPGNRVRPTPEPSDTWADPTVSEPGHGERADLSS